MSIALRCLNIDSVGYLIYAILPFNKVLVLYCNVRLDLEKVLLSKMERPAGGEMPVALLP